MSSQELSQLSDKATNKTYDFIKMIQEDNETTVFDLGNMKNGYNPVLAMAKLKHYHKWNDNGIQAQNTSIQALETDTATELIENKLSQIVARLDTIKEKP